MDSDDNVQALADRLQASLNKAGQISATLAQFAELLVPAMQSFQDALKAPADDPQSGHVGELMALLGQRLDALDERLGEMATSLTAREELIDEPAEGLLEPEHPVMALPDTDALERLAALQASLGEKLDAIEARRLVEQPAGFVIRLEERLRRIETALAMVVGAAAEIAPMKTVLGGLDEKIIALDGRMITSDQIIRFNIAVGAVETATGALKEAMEALAAQAQPLAAVTDDLAAAALVLAERTMPLTPLAETLNAAISGLARNDPSALAQAVGVSAAREIAGQMGDWAQTLEGKIDAAVAAHTPDTAPLQAGLDAAMALGGAARAEAAMGFDALRAAIGDLSGRLVQLSEATLRSRPDLAPLVDGIAATGRVGAEARAEAAAAFDGVKDAISQVVARVEGLGTLVTRTAPNLAPVMEGIAALQTAAPTLDEAALVSRLGAIVDERLMPVLDRLATPVPPPVPPLDEAALVSRLGAIIDERLTAALDRLATSTPPPAPALDDEALVARIGSLVDERLTTLAERLEPMAKRSKTPAIDEAALIDRLGALVDERLAAHAQRLAEEQAARSAPALDTSVLVTEVADLVDRRLSSLIERLETRPAAEAPADTAPDLVASLGDMVDQRFAALAERLESAMGVPGERIATAVRALQDLGEKMRSLDDRAAALIDHPAQADPAPHVKLAEAVASINDLGQRFAGALKRLERRLSSSAAGKGGDDPGHSEVVAIAAQMRENTAEFLAIGAALSMDINRLASADVPLEAAAGR